VNPGIVTEADIVGVDPVGRFFTKIRAQYFVVAGIAFLSLAILIGVLPYALRLPLAPNAVFGLSYRSVVNWLVFIPVVWGFFTWQPYGIATLFRRLAERTPEDSVSRAGLERLTVAFRNPAWPLLAGALAAWEFYWFSSGQGQFLTVGPWWKGVPGLGHPVGLHAAVIFVAAATYYAILLLAIRQCVTVLALSSFFRTHRIEVLALHPDRCGGFRFIGDYALAVAPLVAATGLNFSIVLIRVANHNWVAPRRR
jgi:hypothetical protein